MVVAIYGATLRIKIGADRSHTSQSLIARIRIEAAFLDLSPQQSVNAKCGTYLNAKCGTYLAPILDGTLVLHTIIGARSAVLWSRVHNYGTADLAPMSSADWMCPSYPNR